MPLEILRTVAEVRRAVSAWRGGGAAIGLVPTMGALHEGHMALVRAARSECDRVVVSVFVNPAQFGPGEDFAIYPRDEAGDAAKLRQAGVDAMFAPSAGEMYGPGFATTVRVRGLTEGLCGAFRPVHFEGVATVVTKLLIQVLPDRAYFGEKDYQQLVVVRRLVRDLDLPVEIRSVATVREPDGLALSSRNAFLSAAQRKIAPILYRTLAALAQRLAAQGPEPEPGLARVLEQAKQDLLREGFTRVDYLELRDAETLEPVRDLRRPARLLAAAWLGETRLIDNVPVPPSP